MFDNLNLDKLAKWTGFMGVFSIIIGVLQAITIVGIPAAIIMIILGVKLLGAKSAAKALTVAPEADVPTQFNKMVNDLRVYFQVNGVLVIIGLILGALTVIGLIVALIVSGGNFDFNYQILGE
jgi:amino acid transporter